MVKYFCAPRVIYQGLFNIGLISVRSFSVSVCPRCCRRACLKIISGHFFPQLRSPPSNGIEGTECILGDHGTIQGSVEDIVYSVQLISLAAALLFMVFQEVFFGVLQLTREAPNIWCPLNLSRDIAPPNESLQQLKKGNLEKCWFRAECFIIFSVDFVGGQSCRNFTARAKC